MAVERIVAVAIIAHGRTYSLPSPYRHTDVILDMQSQGIYKSSEQGFLTSTGRFVDRSAAKLIARCAGQIKQPEPEGDKLYSEDIW